MGAIIIEALRVYCFGCGDDITGSSSYRVVPFVRVLFQYGKKAE